MARAKTPPRHVPGSDRRFVGELAASLWTMLRARWPELLAIELASRIAATMLVGVAGLVGAATAVGGLALTALASLVTLTATILQVLVLLRSLRSAPAPHRGRGGWRTVAAGLSASLLPAFVLLSAWGLFRDELSEYALTALGNVDWFGDGIQPGAVLDVPVDAFTLSLLVGCLVVRAVLRRVERRGVGGVVPVALLVEGLWVFLAVQVLGTLLERGLDWFDGTRLAGAWDALASALRAAFGDVPTEALGMVGDAWHVVSVPVVWVTLATITLLGSRPELASTPEPTRLGTWLRRRVDALPSPLDDAIEEATDDLQDRWVPVSQSIRSIARAGVVALGVVVLAWYVLEAACGWLTVGLMHLAGPTPSTLALAVAATGELVGDAVTTLLHLTLAVAALDALRIAAQRSSATPVTSPPASSTSTGSVTPSGTTNPTTPVSEGEPPQ